MGFLCDWVTEWVALDASFSLPDMYRAIRALRAPITAAALATTAPLLAQCDGPVFEKVKCKTNETLGTNTFSAEVLKRLNAEPLESFRMGILVASR